MKIKGAFLSIFLLSILAYSCTNSSDQHSHDHEQHIELNDGAKWQVNDEMKPHIERGEQMLKDYIANDGTDHKQLATDLKEQNSKLISSCTMDGKSHDELHKWLHPHLDLVKKLKSAEDTDATSVIEELSQSFAMYHQYFE